MDVVLSFDTVARLALVVLAAAWVVTLVRYQLEQRSHARMGELLVILKVDATKFVSSMQAADAAMARMGAAARAVGVNVAGLRDQLALQLDEQEAALRLAAVVGIGWSAVYADEVARRAELFTRWWQGMPMTPPRSTARAAALRSVADDVMAGRLR